MSAKHSITRRDLLQSSAALWALSRVAGASTGSGMPVLGTSKPSATHDPAYLANGLVGIRPGPVPIVPAPTYVAGFVRTHPQHQVECVSPAPYPLTTDIRVNGASLLEHAERTWVKSQQIDMATGELTTKLTFAAPGDITLAVTIVQFASRTEPSLLWQTIEIQPSREAKIEIVPQISSAGVPGAVVNVPRPEHANVDDVILFESGGKLSRLGIATKHIATGFTATASRSRTFTAEAKAGQTLRFVTLASLVSSFYHREPQLQAIRMVSWGAQTGVEQLRTDNRRAWAELWRSRVRVNGDADDQRVLDCALFYLHSSVHPSGLNGMPPFGLSQSEHYFGHSFWDTETFSLQPILLASPASAEGLLKFRMRGLPAAQRVAALFGYRGAQYPWEAAPTDGEETTPVFAATGWAEQHIVPDVALAFWQYAVATGDREFLTQNAWPVLREVAKWIESRGTWTTRGFEIHNIMGPNESANGLNNSAYVNLACRMVINAAVRCARLAGYDAPANWDKIARSTYLPLNSNGILMASEGSPDNAFADVSFLYTFDVPVDRQVLERTYEAYQSAPQTEHTIGFAGAAIAALVAGMGDRKRAMALFQESWRPFWMQPYGMIREAAPQTYGCFITDYGSLLQTAMLGFTGIRINEAEWNKYPATLPSNWGSIEIERIFLRGKEMSVIASHGNKAQIHEL